MRECHAETRTLDEARILAFCSRIRLIGMVLNFGIPVRYRMGGTPGTDAQMSCRRRCMYDARLTRREDVSVTRACGFIAVV